VCGEEDSLTKLSETPSPASGHNGASVYQLACRRWLEGSVSKRRESTIRPVPRRTGSRVRIQRATRPSLEAAWSGAFSGSNGNPGTVEHEGADGELPKCHSDDPMRRWRIAAVGSPGDNRLHVEGANLCFQ
jgi:hypothetical protein